MKHALLNSVASPEATYITPNAVAKMSLMSLRSNCIASNLVHRDLEAEFTAAKRGDTVKIRRPAIFDAKEFSTTVTEQETEEGSVDLVLEKHFDVTVPVTSKDMTLKLENFNTQIVIPAMEAMAEKIDAYVYQQYTSIYYQIGTAGDPPDTLGKVAQVNAILMSMRVRTGRRQALINSIAQQDILSIADLVRADAKGDAGTALRDAEIGKVLGVEYYGVHQIQRHTAGTLSDGSGRTALVNAAGGLALGATTMNIDNTSLTGTIVNGDIFRIAGVNFDDGTPKSFVVTNASTLTASTNAITGLTFQPALPQTVADNVVLTFTATHFANIAGDLRGIALAVVPLELPIAGAAPGAVESFEGLGLRVVFDYNSSTKKNTVSFDCLAGAEVIDPRIVARLLG